MSCEELSRVTNGQAGGNSTRNEEICRTAGRVGKKCRGGALRRGNPLEEDGCERWEGKAEGEGTALMGIAGGVLPADVADVGAAVVGWRPC